MSDEWYENGKVLRLIKGDITDLDVEAFVYYARHDLNLGSGFGTAIATRGGPSIQEELKPFGRLQTTQAVTTQAGQLKARYIIHAVGPRFQESDLKEKLRLTILNVLQQAEEKGIRQLAFPPMGTGFYGIPLSLCAEVMVTTLGGYLQKETQLQEVIICLLDNREYRFFQEKLVALQTALEEES